MCERATEQMQWEVEGNGKRAKGCRQAMLEVRDGYHLSLAIEVSVGRRQVM